MCEFLNNTLIIVNKTDSACTAMCKKAVYYSPYELSGGFALILLGYFLVIFLIWCLFFCSKADRLYPKPSDQQTNLTTHVRFHQTPPHLTSTGSLNNPPPAYSASILPSAPSRDN